MHRHRFIVVLVALVVLAMAAARSQAHFHLWDFTEVFSNADGTVQFVEFFTTAPDEFDADNELLRSSTKTYTFPVDLPGTTTNTHFIVATAAFASLPGAVTPDYVIPDNFFNPAGDTLRLCRLNCLNANLYDTRTFTNLPTDGVTSLHYPSVTPATNTPINFADASGSVNLIESTGDYNKDNIVDAADYVVWRKTLDQPASPAGTGADGDKDGMIGLGDLDFWRARFANPVPGAGSGSGAIAAVPEPATGVSLLTGLLIMSACRRDRCGAALGLLALCPGRDPALRGLFKRRGGFDDLGDLVGTHPALDHLPLEVHLGTAPMDRPDRAGDDAGET